MNNCKNLGGGGGIFGRVGEELLMCHMLGGATEILGGAFAPLCPPWIKPWRVYRKRNKVRKEPNPVT